MKTVAVVLNVVLFAFAYVVLATDGLPKEVPYIALTIWMFLTLILSTAVISRSVISRFMSIATIVFNIVMLCFVSWSLLDQYPHPKEAGFIPFVILSLLTPLINLWVLFRGGARCGRPTKIA